jgi:AcrR family transcriptional regulator
MSSLAGKTKSDVVAEFRRAQILEAARDRFTRQGVTETTVEDIAKAARVAKGTVYLYYRSKEDVLRQLLKLDVDELRGLTLPVIQGDADLPARIVSYFVQTLEFFDRKREFMEHCQLELSPAVRREVKALLGRCYQDQAEAWDAVLASACADKSNKLDARRLAGAGWNLVSFARGIVLSRLSGWTDEDIATSAGQAGALVWKGLTTS